MTEKRTTQDLRASLFEVLEGLKTGDIEAKEAQAVCKVADKIISTARLEIDFALALSNLDAQGQEISPGPMLLTDETKTR